MRILSPLVEISVAIALSAIIIIQINNKSYDKIELICNESNPNSIQTLMSIEANTEQCARVTNLIFIKTHKTGSSTVTNILNRFADVNHLIVALPAFKLNRFAWPMPFRKEFIDNPEINFNVYNSSLKYENVVNFITNHLRADWSELNHVIKKPYKVITILRNPYKQLRSAFFYEGISELEDFVNSTNSFGTFLKDPLKYMQKYQMEHRYSDQVNQILFNSQSLDLGFSVSQEENYNLKKFHKFVKDLEKNIDFVLITEYFDESLVILKNELCWSWSDLVYVSMLLTETKEDDILNQAEAIESYRWNFFDYYLYENFHRKLIKKINSYPGNFEEDLVHFRQLRESIQSKCVAGYKTFHSVGARSKVRHPVVKEGLSVDERMFCEKLCRDEISYLDYFRKKLLSKFLFKF